MSSSAVTEFSAGADLPMKSQQHGRHVRSGLHRWKSAVAVVIEIIVVAAIAVGGYLVGSHVTEAHVAQTVNDQKSKIADEWYNSGYFQGYTQGKLYAHVTTTTAAINPSDKTGSAFMWVEKDYGVQNVFFGGVVSSANPFKFALAPSVGTALKTCGSYVVQVDYTANLITAIMPATAPVPLPEWSKCAAR